MTFVALVGIENEGWEGDAARRLWTFSGLLGFAIVYRWVLLSTPLLPIINSLPVVIVRQFSSLLGAMPRGLAKVALGLVDVAFTVLTAGLFNGIVGSAAAVVADQIFDNVKRHQTKDPSVADEDPDASRAH